MQVHRSIDDLAGIPGPLSLAIGVFDGVHLGHQAVLRAAIDSAATLGGTAAALTFDPHPSRVLRPATASRLLTATRHKLRLIEALGIAHVVVVRFDADFAAVEADDFIRRLAAVGRPLARVCVGHGWHFGRARRGNGDLLRLRGAELGFDTIEVAPVQADGRTVSSTAIRAAVESGDLATAARLLGRDYSILGTVVPGDQRGRQLGFPTANLAAHNEQFPPDGVYAVRVRVDGTDHPGVANIGVRPTVDSSGERTLEVHLLDFSDDLYGRDIEAFFIQSLRPEKKFASLDELRTQIQADCDSARATLR